MQPILSNDPERAPAVQPHGPSTPGPMPVAMVPAGAGVPQRKAAPITPDSPPIDGHSAGPIEQPKPKLPGVPGGTPMPKPPVTPDGTPMPKPPGLPGAGTIPGSSGALPTPPSPTTPGGGTAYGSAAYTGSPAFQLMDFRAGMQEFDRNATTREVRENELTSAQLARLLDENGRYIQNARLRAREGAAASGMLMSSFAQGAAERAAIDASLPIAQSDAQTYFQTASENMRALNEDAQNDQNQGRSLFGQAMGLDAQMREAEINRRFQSSEAAADRGFRGEQAGLDRDMTREENRLQRDLQYLMQERGFTFQEAQNALERGFRRDEAEADRGLTREQNALTREQQATLAANQLAQERFAAYVTLMQQRERDLANTLAAIYSNTALKPAEQAAAAQNARAIFNSLNAATNATFAQGIPEIFARPYVMQPGSGQVNVRPVEPGSPVPPGLPTGSTQLPGTTIWRTPDGNFINVP